MTSLPAAKTKLEGASPLDDLPTDRNDPWWTNIRDDYHLTLSELTALKNFAAPPQQQQPNGK